jgi:hypothetical protein
MKAKDLEKKMTDQSKIYLISTTCVKLVLYHIPKPNMEEIQPREAWPKLAMVTAN